MTTYWTETKARLYPKPYEEWSPEDRLSYYNEALDKAIADKLGDKQLRHECSVERSESYGEYVDGRWESVEREHPPCVALANNDDGYYIQYFPTRESLEKFIGELRAAADEAWPA